MKYSVIDLNTINAIISILLNSSNRICTHLFVFKVVFTQNAYILDTVNALMYDSVYTNHLKMHTQKCYGHST